MLKGWEENEGEAPEVCEAQIAAVCTPFLAALSLHLSGVMDWSLRAPEMVHSPHPSPFENQRSPICSDGRSAGNGRVMIKEWEDFFIITAAALERSTGADGREVDAGLRCDNSRLGCCGFTVETEVENCSAHFWQRRLLCHVSPEAPLQASLSTSFRVWKASWLRDSCFQPKPFGLIPSPVQVCCGAGGAEYRERFVCFIPQPNICPQR